MKKLWIWLGLLCCANAVYADKSQAGFITRETVKLEVANWNTWLMCSLPQVWFAKDPEAVLSQAEQSDNPEKRWVFAIYVKTQYRLFEDYYYNEPNYDELLTGGDLSMRYQAMLNSLSDDEKQAVLVRDCNEDWGTVLQQKRQALGY